MTSKTEDSALVGVRYIGRAPVKRDNVNRTHHTWTPGSVVEVPQADAERLLRHPTVWRLANEPWTPGEVPVGAAQVLAAIERGDWAQAVALRPALAGRLGSAPPPLEDRPELMATVLVASELLTRHWVEVLLKGSRDEIEAKLRASGPLLAAAPWLIDELGTAESGARARGNVLDLLEQLARQHKPADAGEEQPGLSLEDAGDAA